MSDISFKPYSQRQEKFGEWFIKRIGKWQVRIYEWSGGRLWNTFLGGPVAILTTIGNKSGQPRKTPLLYLRWQDKVVMVASKGGMSRPPLWLKNLESTPRVHIQIGADKRSYQARHATSQEEQELWPQLDQLYDGYQEYRARCKGVRKIPIIVFNPSR